MLGIALKSPQETPSCLESSKELTYLLMYVGIVEKLKGGYYYFI